MTNFSLDDVSGKAFLLPMLQSAEREVERALRAYDEYGGQLLEFRMETARTAMRRIAAELANLCNTEQAAVDARAEVAMFDGGIIANGISPLTVERPARYET